jgi:hypothetical protein
MCAVRLLLPSALQLLLLPAAAALLLLSVLKMDSTAAAKSPLAAWRCTGKNKAEQHTPT